MKFCWYVAADLQRAVLSQVPRMKGIEISISHGSKVLGCDVSKDEKQDIGSKVLRRRQHDRAVLAADAVVRSRPGP
jgi:hypothetical protein